MHGGERGEEKNENQQKREFNVIIDFFGEINFLFYMLNLFVMHFFV